MISNLLPIFQQIAPKLSPLRRGAEVFSQPILVATAIALGCYLFTVTRWTPLLRSGALLILVAGVFGVLRLFHDASYDRLTGLPNRALFLKRLECAIRRYHQGQGDTFTVFLLDLDQFKTINDCFGRREGDRLLVAIAQRLRRCIHPTSTLARVGGNEFALLRRGLVNSSQAIQLANHLQVKLAPPFYLNGRKVYTTASIGIALSTDYIWADDLLRDAQIALYQAKRLGRARHAIFQPSMRMQADSRTHLETDLRLALERHELCLYYQALVSLETGQIVGFEALARWQHPELGLILPAEFIPIAEDTGLIINMGYWALKQACERIQLWQRTFPRQPPLLVSVNLSGKQFSQPDLIDQVKHVLDETGLTGDSLKLEITESLLMDDLELAIATLEQIKLLNVRLGIDDFGTGYSSLSHLYHFPVDTLKVDQSFIRRIGDNSENDEIVRTIVALAHNLGLNVIAEGIETPTQLSLLRSIHCEYGQGYLFSEPLDVDTAEALLASSPQW